MHARFGPHVGKRHHRLHGMAWHGMNRGSGAVDSVDGATSTCLRSGTVPAYLPAYLPARAPLNAPTSGAGRLPCGVHCSCIADMSGEQGQPYHMSGTGRSISLPRYTSLSLCCVCWQSGPETWRRKSRPHDLSRKVPMWTQVNGRPERASPVTQGICDDLLTRPGPSPKGRGGPSPCSSVSVSTPRVSPH